MNSLKQTVTSYALELGFDLVRVTSSEEFTQDREITLQRLRDGRMAGLPWYKWDRGRRRASRQAHAPERERRSAHGERFVRHRR